MRKYLLPCFLPLVLLDHVLGRSLPVVDPFYGLLSLQFLVSSFLGLALVGGGFLLGILLDLSSLLLSPLLDLSSLLLGLLLDVGSILLGLLFSLLPCLLNFILKKIRNS